MDKIWHLRLPFTTLFISPLIFICSFGQEVQVIIEKPDLKDRGRHIENHISFLTSGSTFNAIRDTSGEKISIETKLLLINGDTLNPETITTRGQSTLHLKRKSYSFDLRSKASFDHGNQSDSLRKFFVLSLSMDKYYHNNRLAYELLEACGLFKLFYSFCEVRINDQSDGIHMIVEPPDEWAMKKKASPLLIRRGYYEKIDNLKTGKGTNKQEIIRYCSLYNQIYKDLGRFKGEQLYKNLCGKLDLDSYMKWLAFNFLIRNGDYTDEVYFYYDPAIKKFSVIPWDYDDLFMLAPHEGKNVNKKVLGDKLLFSAEDQLDKKIATDPYLYNIYLRNFRELLDDLSNDVLRRVFENTYAELYPYYLDKEILSMSQYDVYQNINLENLRKDLVNIFDFLSGYRNFFINYLKDNL